MRISYRWCVNIKGTAMEMERLIVLFVFLTAFLLSGAATDSGNLVFNVQHRYGGRGKSTPAALKAHDANRHSRFLAAIDLPLGGDGQVSGSGLYFTKLAIGSPAKDFYVQVDTGSDILWVNCAGCEACPKESKLGFKMSLYDLKESSSGKQIGCNDDMCNVIYNNQSSCKEPSKPCEYHISYADGSQMSGFFVTDTVHFDQATASSKTGDLDGKISFGCSGKQGGTQGTSTDNVSGIVGLGQGNSSIISQLAAAKKSKKMFAHCLDSVNGGGIFAIGQVVDPKFNSTPMTENVQHYYVTMLKAEVNGESFDIPTESFFDYGRKAVIDSGATLAHLPNDVYDLIMPKITAKHPNLKTFVVDPDLKCFQFDGKVDESFPEITFHFDKSVALKVYPHEYLLHLRDGSWCFGFQRGGMPMPDGGDLILLGDLIISNKLVVYDLENRTIGWAPHNCSASIKVKDETAGSVNSVGNHTISSTTKSSASHAWSTASVLTAVLLVVTAKLIV